MKAIRLCIRGAGTGLVLLFLACSFLESSRASAATDSNRPAATRPARESNPSSSGKTDGEPSKAAPTTMGSLGDANGTGVRTLLVATAPADGSGWFSGGGGGGSFFGLGGRRAKGGMAKHIVYVIDRSGAMLSTFDAVRFEMLYSIGRLDPNQDFHMVFFADPNTNPMEPAGGGLLPATAENKGKAAEALKGVDAKGLTDPIPALSRALDVLAEANQPGGKVLYLLTDSQFPDAQKVIDLCAKHNPKKDVQIFTILYGDRSKEAEATLKKIAEDNGGKYKFVSPDE